MKFTDALRDRAAARMILDPADARYVTGSEEERTKARQEWLRARFTHQVMSSDLEEIPRANLRPLRGPRVLEDTETGDFYFVRLDGMIDMDFVKSAVAYYCAGDGTPVLLERPPGGMPQTRAELERRRAEREQRRNAPKPRRQGKRP